MMQKETVIALVFLVLIPATQRWPSIVPTSVTKTFKAVGQPGSDVSLALDVKSVNGKPIYKLECHDGRFDGQSIISFSGAFHCAFYAVHDGKPTSWNLLAEDTAAAQRSDWLNRGRFLARQLREPCASYQEYGPNRTFEFRGIRLTLSIRDISWAQNTEVASQELNGFTVDVSVVPELSNSTATAALPRALAPPSACF